MAYTDTEPTAVGTAFTGTEPSGIGTAFTGTEPTAIGTSFTGTEPSAVGTVINQREPFRGAGFNPAGSMEISGQPDEFGRGAGDVKTVYEADNES